MFNFIKKTCIKTFRKPLLINDSPHTLSLFLTQNYKISMLLNLGIKTRLRSKLKTNLIIVKSKLFTMSQMRKNNIGTILLREVLVFLKMIPAKYWENLKVWLRSQEKVQSLLTISVETFLDRQLRHRNHCLFKCLVRRVVLFVLNKNQILKIKKMK